jgi:hypothetical protein
MLSFRSYPGDINIQYYSGISVFLPFVRHVGDAQRAVQFILNCPASDARARIPLP